MYQLIHQDSRYLIIFKPAGLQVHPAPGQKRRSDQRPILTDFLLKDFPELEQVGESPLRPGIVHRLDRATAGLMIIPRDQEAFSFFKEQFQQRTIKKVYLALVHGKIKDDSGTIDLPVGRSPKDTAVRSTAPYARDQKPALTQYQVIERFEKQISPSRQLLFTLVEARPRTGRTHQLRVHFKALGHPLYGDPVYKFKRLPRLPGPDRLFLLAQRLEFTDPVGQAVKFSVDPDPELITILKNFKDHVSLEK